MTQQGAAPAPVRSMERRISPTLITIALTVTAFAGGLYARGAVADERIGAIALQVQAVQSKQATAVSREELDQLSTGLRSDVQSLRDEIRELRMVLMQHDTNTAPDTFRRMPRRQ